MTGDNGKPADEVSADAPSLEEVVEAIVEIGETSKRTVGDIVQTLEERSAAPVLLLPALILISPLSGVSGVSTVCGLAIVIVSSQLLIGRRTMWLPDIIASRGFPTSRLSRMFSTLIRPARMVDRLTRQRFRPFTHLPFGALPGSVCLLSGLTLPLMELLPFSATLMGIAVGAMALGLLAQDGIMVLLGMLFAVGIIGTTVSVVGALFFGFT